MYKPISVIVISQCENYKNKFHNLCCKHVKVWMSLHEMFYCCVQ